jgi:hypothetical protein
MSGRNALRVLVLAAASLLLAFQMSRQSSRALSPRADEPVLTAVPVAPPTEDPEPAPPLVRDPFRFGFGPDPALVARARASVALPRVAPAPTPSPLRLVGLVRRGGVLRAAIAFEGEVALAGVGESVFGYAVRGIDEESGVRLQAPDGAETLIAIAPEP